MIDDAVCVVAAVSLMFSNLGNTEAALGPAALLEAAQYSHNRDVYLEPRKDLHSTEPRTELASRNYSAVFDIIVDTGDAFFGCELGALRPCRMQPWWGLHGTVQVQVQV
jgi:hypothetical protein